MLSNYLRQVTLSSVGRVSGLTCKGIRQGAIMACPMWKFRGYHLEDRPRMRWEVSVSSVKKVQVESIASGLHSCPFPF
jgi:hypothetical protein